MPAFSDDYGSANDPAAYSATDPANSPAANVLGGFAQALHLLEFDQIRLRLAGFARTVLGRERALALTPTAELMEVVARQQETDEARRFLDLGGSLEFGPGVDLREYVQQAMLGGMLRGAELNEIRELARAAGYDRSQVHHREDLPLLAGLAGNLPDLSNLEQSIRSAISPAGEILDDASPNLRQLRRDSRSAYQQLNEVMQRSLRRYQRREVVQEPIITQRNGRLVLLIKAEFKSQAPGIVHDVSDSGATVFIEPLPAIETGNHWRETRLAEEREEERVLRSLAAQVGQAGHDLELTLDLLARLDLAMAKGRYSIDRRAAAPVIIHPANAHPANAHPANAHPENIRPDGAHTDGAPPRRLRLSGARHPLLTERVVPINLELGGENGVMVITGPNAGGKTVALKTVGLLALMAHAGLHVPAEQAEFPLLDGIYSDIGDQQSIEQSLSTFSSHIQNLRSILEQVTPNSLVLIDELGTSTDPEEGSALAQAILGHFRQHGVLTIATTHHRGVARHVQEQPGMINASVDLEPGTLEPTYRITLGLPGRSYALTIADRLGLTPEIIAQARSLMSPSLLVTDDLIQELQEERAVVEQLRRESDELLAQARTQQAEVEARLTSVESARLELIEEARLELQNRIGGLLSQLQQAERAVQLAEEARAARLGRERRSGPGAGNASYRPEDFPGVGIGLGMELDSGLGLDSGLDSGLDAAALQEQQAQLAQARREISSTQWQPIEVKRIPWQERLRSGDRVYIRGIPRPVEVITPPDREEHVEVLLGTMRARIPMYQLERPADSGLLTEGSGERPAGPTAERPPEPSDTGSGSGSNLNSNFGAGADPASPGVRFRHNRDAGVYYRRPSPRQVKTDLDLRGQRVDAALEQVENLLNQAALSGVPQIRIIHGHGTGALRRAVREYLHGHPLVASAGSDGDGSNDGATLVELK